MCRLHSEKLYFALTSSESILMPYGIMITNFSKYHISNRNHSYLYEQISIAKELSSNSAFNINLGYFWGNSLNNPSNNISGAILSLWFNR